MFTTGAKLCSEDQQREGNRDAALWTAITRSNHPAFVQGNKALTMTLLSFCFTWQQGFGHRIEMLPVYQHLSPSRPLSLSRGGTGSSSNSISEAPAVCWGKQACLRADTFPSAHSLFWAAAAAKKNIKREDHFCLAWESKAIFTAALLLLSPSCLSDCRMNAEPSKSHHAAALARAYILVCHLPVRPLAVGHHLPHHDAVAPDIAGRCEFTEGDCFRCCPSDGDLPSLEGKEKEKKMSKSRLQRRAENMQKRTKQHFLEH